jgi:hypothetical protein
MPEDASFETTIPATDPEGNFIQSTISKTETTHRKIATPADKAEHSKDKNQ